LWVLNENSIHHTYFYKFYIYYTYNNLFYCFLPIFFNDVFQRKTKTNSYKSKSSFAETDKLLVVSRNYFTAYLWRLSLISFNNLERPYLIYRFKLKTTQNVINCAWLSWALNFFLPILAVRPFRLQTLHAETFLGSAALGKQYLF